MYDKLTTWGCVSLFWYDDSEVYEGKNYLEEQFTGRKYIGVSWLVDSMRWLNGYETYMYLDGSIEVYDETEHSLFNDNVTTIPEVREEMGLMNYEEMLELVKAKFNIIA